MSENRAVKMISLGCSKNRVDSEVMLGLLKEAGYKVVGSSDPADVLIINTCAFIKDAVRESLGTILREAQKKGRGGFEYLVVTGCLPQRYGKSLMDTVPAIDGIASTFDYDTIVQVVDDIVKHGKRPRASGIRGSLTVGSGVQQTRPRVITTPPWTAYVKIAEGCDNRCSYCMIPRLRGPLKSRHREDIRDEVRYLATIGAKEIILVAQDVTLYGRDIYGPTRESPLISLLQDLEEIDGVEWIRLLYVHPIRLDDSLIRVLSESRKIVKYLDLPVQHASDRVLRLMGRPGSAEQYLNVIRKLRNRVDDVTLRSTFMIGFPGEDQQSFAQLLRFMTHARFDYAGFFLYSPEKPTPAFTLPGRVRDRVARRRLKRAATLQQLISYSRNCRYLGTIVRVLIEGEVPQSSEPADPLSLLQARQVGSRSAGAPMEMGSGENGLARATRKEWQGARYGAGPALWLGRHQGQAPEVDGAVLVRSPSGADVRPGRFVDVKITAATAYDLVGDFIRCS
ncbi:MAG TPA: 30S ribosomal protein S12 methylthiotransferase RimO [Clostridia bacterium]|nr:30S ribosomal protein S12 methylthiotransferase RimO [Clostridia bacterium]